MLKKIVIAGPESTGKSSLCKALAAHFNCYWCPEYAREYLSKHGNTYIYDDLAIIANGQIEQEARYTNLSFDKPLLFIDTDMYVMQIWYEYVFGSCPPIIKQHIEERQYDLYLLCKNDLPWIYDPMREYPDEKNRTELFDKYYALFSVQSTPWHVVDGEGQTRIEKAIGYVNQLLL